MRSVAIIGTRGYPSYYGGFETAVRKLGPYLADRGWRVTVYGRRGATVGDCGEADSRVEARNTFGVETQNLSTLSHGLTATLDAAIRRADVALVFNVANGYFLPVLKARGIPALVNVDGIEWERAKWSPLAKRVFRLGAKSAARWASVLVFDSHEIERYWSAQFCAKGIFIPYGGDPAIHSPVPSGLRHRGYVLVVARFVPENSIPEFFDAVPAISRDYPVVIVGSSGYGGALDEAARRLAARHGSVRWLGHVNDDELLLSLWQHAGVYFHGHSVGGTNPALVQAMAAGAPIVARDTVFNREVLGPNGTFAAPTSDAIASTILALMKRSETLEELSRSNLRRAEQYYNWDQVCYAYEAALSHLLEC